MEEGFVDGDTMHIAAQGDLDLKAHTLDFNVLVAPLKTVDRVVKMVPIVRHILAGSLVSIPIKISGDLDDPKVETLPASSVGEGLFGIMKRTVTLPVAIVEPVIRADEKKQKDATPQ